MPAKLEGNSLSMNAPAKLKVGQPTESWGVAHAISLLNNVFDQNISDSLNEFLMLYRSLFSDPAPFSGQLDPIEDNLKELNIHGILYTNISLLNILDAQKVSKILKFDVRECLRVISQVSRKYPESKISEVKVTLKIKLPDEFATLDETERLFLYTMKVLRERRYILEGALEILSKKLDTSAPSTVQNLGKDLFLSSEYFNGVIDATDDLVTSLINSTYITDMPDEFNDLIYKEILLTIVVYLKILVELSINNSLLPNKSILKWFQFMNSISFTGSLNPILKESDNECLGVINGLSTIISITLMDLERNFGLEDEEEGESSLSFMNDASIMKSINDIITSSNNNNSVIMYAWSIILLRKFYVLEDTVDENFDFTKVFSIEEIDHSVNQLSYQCQELKVFHEIDVVNKVLKFNSLYSSLLSTLIIAAMPLITLTSETSTTIKNVIVACPNFVVEKFFSSKATINAMIIARAKFPYQFSPFIKLLSINGSFALNELKDMKSYMCQLNKHDIIAKSITDDENTELVKLISSVDACPPYEFNNKLSLLFTEKTKVKLLPSTDDTTLLAAFLYNYNGLALLGRVLQNLSTIYDPHDAKKISDTIDVLSLMSVMLKDAETEDDALYVITTMSSYMDGSDVTETILRLLEQGLHTRNIKLATAVFDLLYYMNPLVSERIWTYLSTSILLSDGGKEGFVAIFFGSIEMINGDYSFTISFLKLTEALIQDCLQTTIPHSIKMKSKILSQCINHLIFVFETFIHCRFNDSCQKMELGSLILDTFANILTMVYGLSSKAENFNSSNNRIANEVFNESSKLIIDSFLIDKIQFSRTCYPLISLIDSLKVNVIDYELRDSTASLYKAWIFSVLKFSELLISIRSSIGYPPSTFETTIFNKLSILVKCYADQEPFRKDILNLMASLSNGIWPIETRPSLLSHLGRNNTQVLLNSIIVDLDNDFDNYNVKIALYGFLSSVMKGDQEGLAVMLLGVRDIVNNLTKEDAKSKQASDQSLVKVLKNNIKNIDYLPDPVALYLVDALVLVINSSCSIHTLAESGLDEDIDYIDQLINKVNSPIPDNLKTVDDYISVCYKLKLVSKVYEVLALYLFTSQNSKVVSRITDFVKSDNFKQSLNSYFTVKSYHSRLHAGLESEFKNLVKEDYSVSDFRTSLIKRNRFGISTVYNLSVMEGKFSSLNNWAQLKEKIVASSVELQYVSVQIDVSKALGAFITAFCRKYPKLVDGEFLQLCTHLLKTNVHEGLPGGLDDNNDDALPNQFIRDIYHTRIEISFFIIYTIYNTPSFKKDVKAVFELLKTSSELLTSTDMEFIKNLNQSTGYYRPLLRIIYCSLSMIQQETEFVIEYFSIFRDIFSFIVSKGTKTLLFETQNDVYLSKTIKNHKSSKMSDRVDDILLILSILKLFVSITHSPNNQFEICKIIENDGLFRALLNLYSFSHLIEIDGDYIFAQISLMYIQELMKIDIVAQKFIEHGLFTVLQASSISGIIKNGDLTIMSSPQFHRIWTNGILPIFLFSLSNIGPSVLPEVCFGLTTFRKQIESCIDNWSKDSSTIKISTAGINETCQILMIFQMLKNYEVERYLGINTTAMGSNTISDVPILPGIDSEAKREDFMDYINNLLKHPKFLTSRIAPSSIEEQKLIENGGKAFELFVQSMIEDISSLKDYLVL